VDLRGARPSPARFWTLTNQSFSNSGTGLAAIAAIAASRSPVSRWALGAAARCRGSGAGDLCGFCGHIVRIASRTYCHGSAYGVSGRFR
jgi:hypothetical protein